MPCTLCSLCSSSIMSPQASSSTTVFVTFPVRGLPPSPPYGLPSAKQVVGCTKISTRSQKNTVLPPPPLISTSQQLIPSIPGPIARIGPNEIVTSDAAFIRHTTNVRTNYQRSEWYTGMRFDPTKDNVFSTRDDAAHTKLRAKMAAGYSGKDLPSLEPTIDAQILVFISLLKSYITTSRPFDFAPKAQYFTLDTISSLSYSTPFGFLAADQDLYSYLSTTALRLPILMLTTVYPLLVTALSSPILKPLLPSDKDLLGFGRIQSVVKSHVSSRFTTANTDTTTVKIEENDMLTSFIIHGLTQAEAESEAILQFIAGSDTTATAIRATLLYILTNPRILHNIHAELSSVGYTTTTPPSDRVISSHDSITLLPYMQATIKEGLRMHPPVPALLSKDVPPGGDTWKGVYLPPGTKVGFCILGAMRDKDIWGEDAGEFRPERWIGVEEEKLREMKSTLSLVFGNGRWQCLGREIAMMELNKIFVEVGFPGGGVSYCNVRLT